MSTLKIEHITNIARSGEDLSIDTNGNVGIGTATPGDKLAVAGNIAVTGTVDGRDVAADGTKLDGIEASATADQTKSDIEGLGIDVPAANLTGTIVAARLSTATTQAESDDSTKIATTAYVVDKITTLIGGAPSTLNDLNELAAAINDDANYNSTLTTALATKLPLAGGTMTGGLIVQTATGQLRLQGTSNTNKNISIFYNESADYGQINVDESGVNQKDLWVTGLNLKFGRSTSSESMRIASDGNVGIGASSITSGFKTEINHSGETYGIKLTDGSGRNIRFGAGDCEISSTGSNFDIRTTDLKHLIFRTNNVPRMQIHADGHIGFGDNVLNDSAWSTVFGARSQWDTKGVVAATDGSMQIGHNWYYDGGGTTGYKYIASGKANRMIHVDDYISWETTDTAGSAGGEITMTEKMRISSGGNVGIGTTGPGAKLSVSGPAALANLGGGSTGSAALYVNSTSGHTGELIQVLRNGATQMHMANDGKLGLGTASPSVRLHVTSGNGDQLGLNNAGERFTQISLQHSGTQNGALWLDDTDSMVDLYANTSHGIRLKTGGDNPRVTILSGGNVGIGTTSPGRKLDVQGTGNVYGRFMSTNATGAGINVKDSSEDWLIQADGGVGPGLAFYDLGRSAYRLMIDSSGNLGVGATSTSGFKMLVNGNARVQGSMNNTHGQLSIRGTSGGDAQIAFVTDSNGRGIYVDESGSNAMKFYTGYGKGVQYREIVMDNLGNLNLGSGTHTGKGISLYGSGGNGYYISVTGTCAYWVTNHGVSSSTGNLNTFYNNGTYCGGVTITNTNQTNYNSASDYRLKENIVDMADGATAILKQLRPRTFNFISSPESTIEGFVAHEVEGIVDNAVTGTKDELYDEAGSDDNPNIDVGDPKYQSVDPAKLVPLLVKTIQELEARITQLESA